MPDLDTLLDKFRQGDRLALSRLLSLLARGEQANRILAEISPPTSTLRVAITGSAGDGA